MAVPQESEDDANIERVIKKALANARARAIEEIKREIVIAMKENGMTDEQIEKIMNHKK